MIVRRELMIALGACSIDVPFAVQAQQPTKPARVAWLANRSPELGGYLVDAFTRRMRELGYIEGKDVVYEIRWARGKAERFPEFAQKIVALRPDVIFATGGLASILAAQQATTSIPIVAVSLNEPVTIGPRLMPSDTGCGSAVSHRKTTRLRFPVQL